MRVAALGAGMLLLAGCATGYSFVQPDVAGSGGYYTNNAPYSGQGYYDLYGTGPYYPGTSGWGYYNGTWPYGGGFGYFGPDYGYGPQWIFNFGVSSVWDFPGYWGPWYSTGYPLWGCWSWRCGARQHGWHGHHDHDHSWRHDDHPSRPADLTQAQQRARQRASDLSAWRSDHYVRAPRRGTYPGRFAGIPPMPAGIGNGATRGAAFGNRSALPTSDPVAMPAPREFSRAPRSAPQPSFHSARPIAPMRAPSRVAPSPSRHNGAPATKIR